MKRIDSPYKSTSQSVHFVANGLQRLLHNLELTTAVWFKVTKHNALNLSQYRDIAEYVMWLCCCIKDAPSPNMKLLSFHRSLSPVEFLVSRTIFVLRWNKCTLLTSFCYEQNKRSGLYFTVFFIYHDMWCLCCDLTMTVMMMMSDFSDILCKTGVRYW